MAHGLLVCLVGEGTKISDYLLNENKAYRATVRLGLSTDTLDLEGQVLEHREVQVDEDMVKTAGLSLRGDFDWSVPVFSAVKVAGEKLYEKGRKGETVVTPIRRMTFQEVEYLGQQGVDVSFLIRCSKGSFIRTWAAQLGKVLGVPSCLADLERLESEPFHLEQALALGQIEGLGPKEVSQSKAFLPLSECLPRARAISLKGRSLKLLVNGQIPHELERRLIPDQRELNKSEGLALLRLFDGDTGELRALLQMEARKPLKLKRVFKRP